jgi:hypothetical protein
MIHAQDVKYVSLIPPQAIIDNAYWSGSHGHGSVNNAAACDGFNYATFVFYYGTSDIAMAELSLYEADVSTYAIISGSDINSVATLPSSTDDNKFVIWHVPLAGRKRYIRINAKGGDGSAGAYGAGWAVLSRGQQAPNTTTERGVLSVTIL